MASTNNRNRKSGRSRASSPGSGTPGKKKRPVAPATVPPGTEVEVALEIGEEPSPLPVESEKIPVFKDPTFVHSSKGAAGNKRTRVWKNLKQIIAAERSYPWKPEDPTYGTIDAPPSFKPARKYSDISGLPAKYKDPQTKLRYATAEEYSRLKMMPSDLVAGCLALRRANTPVP